jgi:hypothetical protein
VARAPAEECVSALDEQHLERIGQLVRQGANVPVEVFSPIP